MMMMLLLPAGGTFYAFARITAALVPAPGALCVCGAWVTAWIMREQDVCSLVL
jgi:hypothetical protein